MWRLLLVSFLFIQSAQAARKSQRVDPCVSPLLTESGREAVMGYFLQGIYLNALLIEKVDKTAVQDFILERAHQAISAPKLESMKSEIDASIDSQTPFLEEFTVFRGQGINVPRPANGILYEEGEILVFPQFLSTSEDPLLAEGYAKGVLLTIKVPAGFKGLNLQTALGLRRNYEWLFARNSKVKVLIVETGGKHAKVSAEMVD